MCTSHTHVCHPFIITNSDRCLGLELLKVQLPECDSLFSSHFLTSSLIFCFSYFHQVPANHHSLFSQFPFSYPIRALVPLEYGYFRDEVHPNTIAILCSNHRQTCWAITPITGPNYTERMYLNCTISGHNPLSLNYFLGLGLIFYIDLSYCCC